MCECLLLEGDMMKERPIIEKYRFPSPHPLIHLYSVTYFSQGYKVKGLLAEPVEQGMYEGLLYLRGGIKNVGKVRPSRITQLASEGFVVFAPFYRGNQGGEGDEDIAGEDRYDAFSGFEILREHPKVKTGRIHIFGFSRGGVMALWTAIQYRDAASVVTWGGVSDVFLMYEEREDLRRMMKRVIGGSPWKMPELYRYRTPLYEIEKLHIPLLIIHGERDKNVSIEHAYQLGTMAKMFGKQVETWYFPTFAHHFPPRDNRKMVKEMMSWMKNR